MVTRALSTSALLLWLGCASGEDEPVRGSTTVDTACPAGEVCDGAGEMGEACDDGLDNDDDGRMDCDDYGCADAVACDGETLPEGGPDRCVDGIDNDRDGAIDCDDSDCDPEC